MEEGKREGGRELKTSIEAGTSTSSSSSASSSSSFSYSPVRVRGPFVQLGSHQLQFLSLASRWSCAWLLLLLLQLEKGSWCSSEKRVCRRVSARLHNPVFSLHQVGVT